MKPKVLYTERISARLKLKIQKVIRIEFLLKNFSYECVVILNQEYFLIHLDIIRWLQHYQLDLVELFLYILENSPFSLPNKMRCREGS